jgi:hypothetical protein
LKFWKVQIAKTSSFSNFPRTKRRGPGTAVRNIRRRVSCVFRVGITAAFLRRVRHRDHYT